MSCVNVVVSHRHSESPVLRRSIDKFFSMYLEHGGANPHECQVHNCCNSPAVTSTAYLGEDGWFLTRICEEHKESARASTLPLRSDAHLIPFYNLRV